MKKTKQNTQPKVRLSASQVTQLTGAQLGQVLGARKFDHIGN